jgi:transcriptional regulator of arginine metabolism
MEKARFSKRLSAIQELVKTHLIEDQTDLIELLQKQYGIETNQAAISRDLRKLGIHKRAREGTMVYELPHIDIMAEILRYAVVSIRHNEALIVITTIGGTAAFVGDYLDTQTDLNILGTLAGENMVFVTPTSMKDIEDLSNKLCHRLKVKE